MSSIAGIVAMRGPLEGNEIHRMLDALDHWGADRRGSWVGRDAALGHLLLHTGARTRGERHPCTRSDSGYHLTGDVRLDNRGDVVSALGLSTARLRELSDAEVVLRAYEAWGDGTPERLIGDFAFAVWSERERTLFCARDPFGVRPFFYHDGPRHFAFASEIKGVLALTGVSRVVDEVWVADFLCRLVVDAHRTLFREVRRLEPGHALRVGPGGLRRWSYRRPIEEAELPGAATDADLVDGFLHALRTAVERRLPDGLDAAAELSGGLDSSGICAVANEILRADGRALHTFAQVGPVEEGAERLPDDGRDAIEELVRHADLPPPALFSGEGPDSAALVDWAVRHCDEPPRLIVGLYSDGLYEAVRERGGTVLLSGYGGNQGVTSEAKAVVPHLMRRGRIGQLRKALPPDRRGLRLAEVLAKGLVGLVPGTTLLRKVLEGPDPFLQKLPYRPISHELAERVDLPARVRAHHALRRVRGVDPSEITAAVLSTPSVALRLEHDHAHARPRRIERRYPLLDPELVSYYRALPPLFKRRDGVGRWVFRESLRGMLPEGVRTVSHRASANPGSVLRARRGRDTLVERVRALPGNHPIRRYADVEKVLERPTVVRSTDRPWERNTALVRVLALAGTLEPGLLTVPIVPP